MKNPNRNRIRRLTQFSLLLAIEIILGFTFGMIMVPPVSITLMHIPVIITGIVLGPLYGGAMGGAFGLISMYKATTAATPLSADIFFSPFLSGRPVASLVMCLVPRILLGIFVALLFSGIMKLTKNKTYPSIAVSAGLSTILHSVMVLTCFWLFFQALPFVEIFTTILTLNGLLEIGAAVLLAIPVCGALLKYMKRNA